MTGTRMSAVALPWFVLVSTGSVAKMGVVAAAETLPYVLACGLGGPLLDRLGYRRVSIVADAASAAAVLAIPFLGLNFSLLVGLVAVAGGLRGLGDTSKRVIFRQSVMTSGVDVTRATSINDGLLRLTTLLGAPLAGLLIAAFDAQTVLIIDAGTFGFGAAAIAIAVPAIASTGSAEPYLKALRGGFSYLRQDRLVAGLLVIFFCTNLFDSAYGSVLIPLWAKEVIGSPVALGLVSASFAVGAVLGNVVFTVVAPRVPRFATYAVGFVIGGAPRFLVPAFTDEAWPLYLVSFIAGLGMASVNPIIGAVMFERVPEHMLARVQGLGTAVAWGGIPVGALIGGWLGGIDLAVAFVVLGIGYLVVTLVPFTHPIWRQIDIKPEPATAAVGEQAAAPQQPIRT
ncbi:MFS transporter [Rhizocola hellebori]|uniref:MFS transporter n=1 Tax=Rhizocola hellebori TaxID=1392758 RepID=A0A8J3VEI6_9ACTN|nr:MFS transporter [Rhizocola hellebori]